MGSGPRRIAHGFCPGARRHRNHESWTTSSMTRSYNLGHVLLSLSIVRLIIGLNLLIKKMTRFIVFLVFFPIVFYGILCLVIIPEWLINDSHFLDDFWNFQHVHKIWTFSPLFYVGMLQQIREIVETSSPIYVHISTFWKSKVPKMFDTTGHQKCGTYV